MGCQAERLIKKKKKPNAKFLLPSICGKSLFSFFFLLFQWKIISLFFVQNASMLMLNYADFKIFFYHVIIAVFVLPSCKPLYNHIFKIPHKTTDRTIFRSDFDWARLCKTAWPSSWLWPEIIEKCPPLPLNPFYSTSPFPPLMISPVHFIAPNYKMSSILICFNWLPRLIKGHHWTFNTHQNFMTSIESFLRTQNRVLIPGIIPPKERVTKYKAPLPFLSIPINNNKNNNADCYWNNIYI